MGSDAKPDDIDAIYLNMKGALERICRAQVLVPAEADVERAALDSAARAVQYVGWSLCPEQWSRFDAPMVNPSDEGSSGGE